MLVAGSWARIQGRPVPHRIGFCRILRGAKLKASYHALAHGANLPRPGRWYDRGLRPTKSRTGRHSTGTAAIVLLRLFLVLASCVPALAQQTPSPGPEHRKLQIWIGEWTYSGVAHETPLGPRTEFSGGFSDQSALNGFYVQGRWKDTFGEGIELHGYDAAAKAHKAFWFGDDGSRYDLTETYGKDTVSAPFTMTDAKGKQVRGKAVWKFSSDHSSFSAKWELSTDNGKTWIPWMEYAGKKVKK